MGKEVFVGGGLKRACRRRRRRRRLMGEGANAGAEAEAGAEAVSGAATEGANTDSEAGDGGDDARVAFDATLAGGGAGATAEGAIAAAGEAFDGETN